MVREGDLVLLVLRGALFMPQARALRETVERILSESPRCYILADLREMTTMDAESRRYLGDWGRTAETNTVTAIFGMSFAVRVLTMLLLNAIRVMGRSHNQTRLFDSEGEARAWLAEQRRSGPGGGAQGSGGRS